MTKFVPTYVGTVVRRITMEPGGLALWVLSARDGSQERCFLLEDARALLASTPEGIARNELTDAIRLCDTPRPLPAAAAEPDDGADDVPLIL